MTLLRAEDITAGYGDVMVLRNVSLTIPDASSVALLGPNGAGKTTFLKVLSGLIKPRSGRLHIDDEDVTGSKPSQLASRGVCHIPEGRGIFPSLSVRENLRLFKTTHGDALDRAIDVFPRLGERINQVAGTMSGGEQQMLALARAYVQSPRVVLLDEVSMGLAPKIVDQIFDFLAQLAAEGVALLVVEQYVDKALNMTDYVALLDHGHLTFVGESGEIDADELHSRYLGGGEVQSAART